MRLIRKTTYKRVTQIPEHKKVLSTFEKFKEDPNIDRHNSLKKTKDASTLNYFFALEFESTIGKKINFKNFIEKDENNNEIVNLDKLLDEKNRIEDEINERRKKEPVFFQKLGYSNQVIGCYLIGTNKKNMGHIKDMDFKNKNNLIVIKLNNKKLPKEFEEMCNQYYKRTQEKIRREQEDFEKFIMMNPQEQENYIKKILENIVPQPPHMIIIDNINIENGFSSSSGYTFFDGFSENNIQTINNIEFLETLLLNAEQKEQYEFCAKIRDRIKEIKINGKV